MHSEQMGEAELAREKAGAGLLANFLIWMSCKLQDHTGSSRASAALSEVYKNTVDWHSVG